MPTLQPPQSDLILLAFERNSRVNAAMLASIADDDLHFAADEGWSIGKHLCHLASFRYGWLTVISPEHASTLTPLIEFLDDNDFLPLATHVNDISNAFRDGDAAALEAVNLALAEHRDFQDVYRSHPTDFLMHILIHDAHHRGQVMSLLRQSGRTKAEMDTLDDASWPVWRE